MSTCTNSLLAMGKPISSADHKNYSILLHYSTITNNIALAPMEIDVQEKKSSYEKRWSVESVNAVVMQFFSHSDLRKSVPHAENWGINQMIYDEYAFALKVVIFTLTLTRFHILFKMFNIKFLTMWTNKQARKPEKKKYRTNQSQRKTFCTSTQTKFIMPQKLPRTE